MKRLSLLFMILAMVITLTACNNGDNEIEISDSLNSDNSNISSTTSSKKTLKTSELKIEDFVWETNVTKYNGYDCYALSLINNSDFDIIGVEFTYKVKEDVTDDKLVVYDEFMKEHDGYIEADDSPRGVILKGNKDQLIEKGSELTGLRFTVGFEKWSWYDYPTEEQFGLMEPKELKLGIVSENKLYIAYYDFKNESWKLDEDQGEVNIWSNWEVGNKITKPNEKHYVTITNEENKFKIYSYGIFKDDYNEYVENLKSLGFVENSSSSSFFKGTDADGYEVELWYYSDEERLSINIEKR